MTRPIGSHGPPQRERINMEQRKTAGRRRLGFALRAATAWLDATDSDSACKLARTLA